MDKTKIDWCGSTWNLVTGCLHGREYCYARDIVKRFSGGGEDWTDDKLFVLNGKVCGEESEKACPHPYGFLPTLHRYRLNDYRDKKGRNIFVCFVADLFSEWVPDSWIEEVFEACGATPQHNYLFLIENPKRYEKLLDEYMPPNMWFGWSQAGPMGVNFSFTTHCSVQTFISIESLLKPFEKCHIRGIDWIIIGTETGHRKDKIILKRKWIKNIVERCQADGILVFIRSSLLGIWGDTLIQKFPKFLVHGN